MLRHGVIVTAGAAALAFGTPGCDRDEAQPGAKISELRVSPESRRDERIRVYGEVEARLGDGALVLSDGLLPEDEIYVVRAEAIAPRDFIRRAEQRENVVVSGYLRPFSPRQLAEEFGVDVDASTAESLEGKYVMVASAIAGWDGPTL